MNQNIVKKSFYLTSLFADIKSEHSWTVNEAKLVLLLLSELSNYRIYLPDFNNFENNISEFNSLMSNVPNRYIFSKFKFQEVTGIKNDHLSREIKKIIKSLISKTIITPHPLDIKDDDSIEAITWFTKINYLSKTGEITLQLNRDAKERLVAFVKYSKISFDNIVKIQNHNALFLYLTLRILIDSSKLKEITMSINDFKEKLGLLNKYKSLNLLKTKVLKVVKDTINEVTDLNLDYELIKEGRAFTKIKFNFDYKTECLDEDINLKVKNRKSNNIIENVNISNYDSPFEAILVNWGIRAKTVVEIEEEYSLDVIQEAIDITLEKDKAGEIQTTKASIFLGILQNKQLVSNEKFEREKRELAEQEEKKIRAKVSAEYDRLSSFILSNEDIIKSALTASYKYLPIIDKDAIPIFRKLKGVDADKFRGYKVPILTFYHFETDSYVSSTLSDVLDRSEYIEIVEYRDDMEIIQAYKKSLVIINENKYITDDQKQQLKKEVQDSINILIGL